MRGVLVFLAVLFVAANITVYEQADTFTVDDTLFTIENLLEDRTNIRVNQFASIWRVDDCQNTINYIVCLTAATNQTATISVEEINTSYTLTRSIPDRVQIGEPFRVELTITNHAPTQRTFTLTEHTTARTEQYSSIQSDLTWTGTIAAESQRTLAYTAIITTPTTFTARVAEPYEKNHSATVRVDDFVTATTNYVNQTTTDSTYEFRTTLRLDEEAETYVLIQAPGLQISNRINLTQQLTRTFLANQTPYFGFNYKVPQGMHTNITVTVTTETSTAESTRTYTYPVRDAFSPIQIIHDYKDAQLPVNQDHPISLTFINPNNRTVNAQLRAVSVLADIDTSITLPPSGVAEHTFSVRPNVTNSDYTILVTLTYNDVNDVETITQDSLRIRSVTPQTPPSTEQPTTPQDPSMRMRAQQTSTGYNLLITPNDFTTTNGTLVIRHFAEVIYNDTILLNQTLTLPVQTHGTYRAQLTTNQTTVTAEHVINQPPEPVIEETPLEEETTNFLLLAALIFLGLTITVIGLRAAYLHRRLEHLMTVYEQTQAFITTFTPKTPEDQERLAQLQQELARIQQEIADHKH